MRSRRASRLRSFGALGAGLLPQYLFFLLLEPFLTSMRGTSALLVGILIGWTLLALGAGYLTARLARRAIFAHVLLLGLLSLSALSLHEAPWRFSGASLWLLWLPLVASISGGYLRVVQQRWAEAYRGSLAWS